MEASVVPITAARSAGERQSLGEPPLRKRELASLLGMSERQIERWMHEGLPFEKWGPRTVRFYLGPVRRWLAGRSEGFRS